MKTRKKWTMALCGLLAVIMALLTGCVSSQTGSSTPTEEKDVVEGSGSWVYYTFEEAVKEADVIVYGTAGERGETKVREGTEGESSLDYYREIPITVKEVVKGEDSETVAYKEYGGETDDTIYRVLDFDPLESGKDYILFLHEDGFSLPPYTLLLVEDGIVHTTNVPDSALDENGQAPESIPVDDYIAMIQEAM